ncbi:MAG: hypothetical protein MI785_15005 [Kiloniellales bacterium]|nr:hypothetical protein [Kiloniellales bacterium]
MKLPVTRRARLQAASAVEMALALHVRYAAFARDARNTRQHTAARRWASLARNQLAAWLALKGLAR